MKNDKLLAGVELDEPEYRPIPRSQFSQFATKLDVDYVDPEFHQKWHPYWMLEGQQISAALASGYEFVDKSEVKGADFSVTPRDNDPGTRVRRSAVIGTGVAGQSNFHYLMKLPMEFHLAHEAEREAYLKMVEGSIREGEADRQANDGRYSAAKPPPGGTSLPRISVKTNLSR